MIKLKVDKNQCIGCGACVSLYPKFFLLGSDGKSKALDSKKELSKEEAERIAACCPVGAIKVEL